MFEDEFDCFLFLSLSAVMCYIFQLRRSRPVFDLVYLLCSKRGSAILLLWYLIKLSEAKIYLKKPWFWISPLALDTCPHLHHVASSFYLKTVVHFSVVMLIPVIQYINMNKFHAR
jgi:hypothetical protein